MCMSYIISLCYIGEEKKSKTSMWITIVDICTFNETDPALYLWELKIQLRVMGSGFGFSDCTGPELQEKILSKINDHRENK